MNDSIGAPGSGISRRDFVKASGLGGTLAVAGCVAPGEQQEVGTADGTAPSQSASDLPTTSPPEIVNVDEQGGQVTLSSVPARHDAHPGDTMGGPVELPQVWAWQADGGDPSVPGPILRTTEGQPMEVTFDNTDGKRPHTIHFHAVEKNWEDDGVPTTTGIRVDPGEKHTYNIPANVTGTHVYHCHYQTHRHIDMGMYGIFRVDPKGYEPADKEYFMTLKEWDSRLNQQMAGMDANYDVRNRRPDTFTINGKSAPHTLHPEEGSPIIVEQGDTVRLHLCNNGYMDHPMHFHNHRFQVTHKDGGKIPEAARHDRDITSIPPASRHTIEFEADSDPGIYLAHCHKVSHVMNGSAYPGGMLSAIVYKDAMDTDIFAELMEYAGYEG